MDENTQYTHKSTLSLFVNCAHWMFSCVRSLRIFYSNEIWQSYGQLAYIVYDLKQTHWMCVKSISKLYICNTSLPDNCLRKPDCTFKHIHVISMFILYIIHLQRFSNDYEVLITPQWFRRSNCIDVSDIVWMKTHGKWIKKCNKVIVMMVLTTLIVQRNDGKCLSTVYFMVHKQNEIHFSKDNNWWYFQ